MTFVLVTSALTLLHPAALRPPALLATPPQRAAVAPSMLDAGAAWSAYNAALVDPSTALLTKSVTAGVIIGAGDAAAQLVEGSKTGAAFDGARYLRWAIFGLVLQGPWNHAWYLTLDGLLPPTEDPFSLITLEKVGLDQFFQAPIFTMVILCFFALVEGKGLAFAKTQIQEELGAILIKNWAVFLPATFINLAFLPNEYRVLFLNVVFFGWVIYLSLLLNADEEGASASG
jgi:peroxisomal membrane protein 2